MAERNLPAALKTSLLAEEEYVYAHLVKFEKPRQSSEVGETSGKASDYSYITDGSVNISFNDETVNSRGNANGTQTYVANKLMSVGTIQETTEARASNMSIVLSGTALGTIISANVSFTSTTLTADVDLFTNGFQEGDKIYLESNTGTNDKKYITVKSFSNNNQTITFTSEQGISLASSTAYTLSLASEELTALIRNKNTSTGLAYSSYMNREVFIYRVHINPETGAMIGAPFQIFRGIIAKGSISENPKKATTVTWNLTSHWGDFVRIQGRITADAYHRALTTSGTSDIGALINPAYGTDYGFMHAESAVNVTAIYQTQETRYKMKKRGGLAGLMGGKKLVEYEVTVDREVDLQFNLSGKYLPIVYGVQKVDSIPVFADTLADDPATLYIAYAICEGEIGGIYDIHIDDSSTVCIDKSDFDVRSSGDADVLCNGRADKGDVLAANGSFVTTTTVNIFGTLVQIPIININYDATRAVVLGAETNAPGGQGLLHETSFTFSTPIDATFMVHTGKSDQRANQELVNIATEQKFKIQNDYFIAEADARPYWSGSHKLLDTTYAVGKFTLSEGEVTIPKYEFVVRGKLLDCYNYDGSYVGEGNHTNFSLGDTVNIYAQGTNSLLTSDVRIIDKWSFYDAAGTIKYRFRFNKELTLESTTAFYMSDGSNTYNFFTWDHVEGTGLTLEGALSNVSVSSITVSNSTNKGSITLSSPSALVENILTELGGFIKFDLKSTINGVEQTFGTFTVESYNSSTNVITTVASHPSIATLTQAKSGSGKELIFKNVLRLDSTDPNTIDAAYLGKKLKVTNYLNDIPYSKEFIISAYDGGLKVATTSTNYEEDDVVISSLSDYVVKVDADQRVSINPAIQLLDYLTSNRYGKGLDINKDIDLDSFKVAAQICDTQSDVTIISTQPATVLDKYTYTASGRLLFEGTVKSSTLRDVGGTSYYEIIFTNVIGKLGYKWNNWRSYTAGDIYWHVGKVYIAGSTGTITTTPTGSGALTSLSLTKVGGGTLAISITDGYTSSGNPIVKSFTNTTEGFNSPGYSLYDSDDVKYWKYLGWDESEQRYVTRHQMNQVINTSTPLFDNINSMLEQFNGILRYSAGKYSLDVETASPTSFASFQSISEGDILGDIKVDDKGQKDAFNSMSANIVDPANKYAGRSISFFNSEYLKEDKGIRRQGNFAMPGISNYYNARINIKQYLDESRYGITISFTIDSKGYLLLAGSIITLTHSRFGWVNKEFRISSLNFQENGLVDIVAEEHNNDAYLVENVRSSLVSGDSDSGGSSQIRPTVIGAPTDLTATLDKYNAIELSWTNAPRYNAAYTTTLIYYAEVDDFAESAVLAEVVGSSYSHVITAATSELYYYWIRHSLVKTTGATVLSGLNALEGTPGQSLGIIGSVSTILSSSDYSIVYDESGLNPTYTDQTGTVITGTGNILLTATTNLDTPLYRFTLDGIVGSWTETSTTTFSIPSQFFESSILMKVEVAVKPDGWTGDGDPADPSTAVSFDEISIIPVRAGSGAIAIVLSNEAHTVPSDTDGGNPVLTGSGTSIEVFEGATVLTPITSGTATAGQYTVATSVINGTITPNSSPSVAAGIITFGDHSAFTTDNAVIKYTIQGLRLDGVTGFTLEKIQSLSKALAGVDGVDGADGADGSDGVNSRSVDLTAGTIIFTYNAAGTTPSPSRTTVTATANNTTGTVYYEFFKNNVSVQNLTSNTYSYTPPTNISSMPDQIEVQIREGSSSSTILARDQITVGGVQPGANGIDGVDGGDGVDAITTFYDNQAHTVPVTNTGVETWTGSGGNLNVFDGTTELVLDSNSQLASYPSTNGRYRLNITRVSGDTLTEPTITGAGTAGATLSAFAGNLTTATQYLVDIYVKALDGTQYNPKFKISLSPSFEGANGVDGVDGADGADGSDGVNARSTDLTAGTVIFTYDAAGTTPSPSSTTVTATANNTTGTVYYEFFKDNVSVQNSTSNTYSYTPQTTISSMPDQIEVQIREGSSSSTILARDQITIGGIRPGANGANGADGANGANGVDGLDGSDGVDAITTFYDNQAHTVPVTNTGVETWTGSGGNLNVFDGTTELVLDSNSQLASYPSTNGRYRLNITRVSGDTLTEPTITGAGTAGATLSAFAGNLTTATQYLVDIYVKALDGTQYNPKFKISLSPSFEGANGVDGVDGADGATGATGATGPTGFFYVLQNNTSTPVSTTIPAGTYTAGQIAIVQNNNGVQAGFRYNGSVWQAQTIVNKDIIFANAIDAEQLRISNTTGGSGETGIYMNGINNRIEIWDSGVRRIKIGNLAE